MSKTYRLADARLQRLVDGDELAVASDRITVEGAPVALMRNDGPQDPYHDGYDLLEEPWEGETWDDEAGEYVGPVDSGWRFLAAGDDAAIMDTAAQAGIHTLNAVANYDPAILPYLGVPEGLTLRRAGDHFEVEIPPPVSVRAERWFSLRLAAFSWLFVLAPLLARTQAPALLIWATMIFGALGVMTFTPGAVRPLHLRADADGLVFPRRFRPGVISLNWQDISEIFVMGQLLVIRFRKGYRPPSLLMRLMARFSYWKGAAMISKWTDVWLGEKLERLRVAVQTRDALPGIEADYRPLTPVG